MRFVWLLCVLGVLVAPLLTQEDDEVFEVDDEYEEDEDGEYEEVEGGDEGVEDDGVDEDDTADEPVEPPVVEHRIPVTESKHTASSSVGGGENFRVVKITFTLNPELYQKIDQIDALTWQDPAWSIETVPEDVESSNPISVIVHAQPDINLMKTGEPGVYKIYYDLVYRGDKTYNGKERYSLNGGPEVDVNVRVNSVAQRLVEVTEVDWCKYLNRQCANSHECTKIQALGAPAGPVSLINLDLARCVSGLTNPPRAVKPGKFSVECKENYVPVGQVAEYGLFQFPSRSDEYPKCVRVNQCIPSNKCGEFAECIPLDEQGNFECKCKPGFEEKRPVNSNRRPSDPLNCVPLCDMGQSGAFECSRNPCHKCDSKTQYPFYQCMCDTSKQGCVQRGDGSCEKECDCDKISSVCVPSKTKAYEYDCKCKNGFNEVGRNAKGQPICEKEDKPKIVLEKYFVQIDQCDYYHELGWKLTGGKNNINNYEVEVRVPPALTRRVYEHSVEHKVDYVLMRTSDNQEVERVQRNVAIKQIDRCTVRDCGAIRCKDETICSQNLHHGYPNDIRCDCYEPPLCLDPNANYRATLSSLPLDLQKKTLVYAEELKKLNRTSHYTDLYNQRCYQTKIHSHNADTSCVDVSPPVVVLYGKSEEEVRSCKVCQEVRQPGEFVDAGAFAFDFNDGPLPVSELPSERETEILENGDEVVTRWYKAIDRAGNTNKIKRKIVYKQDDISKEIDEMRKLYAKYKDQLDTLSNFYDNIITWVIQLLIILFVTVCLWVLFTVEGWRFFRAVCIQILNPDQSWAAIQADLDRDEIEKHRRSKANSSRSNVSY